jgi:tetratricopeptide (TPR) repeat protein
VSHQGDPQSLQDVIRSRQAHAFVGREEPVTSFMANLQRGADDAKRIVVFAIDGQAGTGKSYLTRRLCSNVRDLGDIASVSDDESDDVLLLLDSISMQLNVDTGQFDQYLQLSAKYRRLREGMLADSAAPTGLATILTNASVRLGLGVAKSAPGLGDILNGLETDVAVEQVESIRSFLAKQLRRADGELLLNPVPTLTSRFLVNLRRAAIDHANVVIAIDTFERRSERIQQWLLATLSGTGTYGLLPANLVVVVSGQNPLDANAWSGLNHVTERFSLKEFSESEVSVLLGVHGPTSSDAVSRIMQLTGGLPVLVGMLTKEIDDLDGVQQGSDAAETAVERFLKHEQDADRRNIILKAAIARWLDADTLSELLDDDSVQQTLAWLSTFPFVKKRNDKWIFHGVVRTMMIRYQRDRDRDLQQRAHIALGIYHADQAVKLTGRSDTATFDHARVEDHTLEALYHGLCVGKDQSLSTLLRRVAVTARSRTPILSRLLSALSDAADYSYGETYHGLHSQISTLLAESDSIQGRERLYSMIIESGHVHSNDLARVYLQRARLRINEAGTPELGIYDCNKAINATDGAEEGDARSLRARACLALGQSDKALEDLDWCLSKSPDDAYILYQRHKLLVDLEQYAAAERDISAAVAAAPRVSAYRSLKANYLLEFDREDDAFQEYTKAVELADSDHAIRSRANAYRFCRRYVEALADFEILKNRDASPEDLVRLGEVLRLLGRPQDALSDAIQGAAGEDINGWAHLAVGLIYRDLGESRLAVTNMQRAVDVGLFCLRQDAKNIPALFNTAMALAALGSNERAQGNFFGRFKELAWF